MLLTVVGVATVVPSSARAATFNCEASALRGVILGGAGGGVLEPVTANRGADACRTQTAGGAGIGLPSVLTGGALAAQTALQGPADRVDQQQAGASGGVSDLSVLSLPDLPIQLPTAQVPAIPPVDVGLAKVDLTPAVQALIPDGRLPNLELIRVRSAYAFAGGQCVNGTPRLDATSQVSGVNVLGQDLSVNQIVEQTLSLANSQVIDPSQASLANVKVLNGVTLNPALAETVLRPVLDALPNIEIPATLAVVRVTPGGQERTADSVVQRALRVEVAIAGQPVADLAVGEAKVSSAGVDCVAATPAAAANQAALRCTKRRLVLTDVVRRGKRVRLVGAADRKLRGKTVKLVFTATRKTVARAKISRAGTFKATAKLPPKRIRDTNRARYQAVVGKERSLRLKLQRRMKVTGVRVRRGKVTISGRVSRPLAKPARTIVVKRRVSCRRTVVVKKIRPRRDGTFRVTVSAPPRQLAAVYRLGTRVRKSTRKAKTYPTFTLPRAVALG